MRLFWLCMHGLAVTTMARSGLLVPLLLSLLEDSESKSDTSRLGPPPPNLLAWGLSCWSSSLSQLRCRFLLSVSISAVLTGVLWQKERFFSEPRRGVLRLWLVLQLHDHFAEPQNGILTFISS